MDSFDAEIAQCKAYDIAKNGFITKRTSVLTFNLYDITLKCTFGSTTYVWPLVPSAQTSVLMAAYS